ELPFEQLVEELNPERDLSRNPVVQVVYQLQNMAGRELADLELSGLDVSLYAVATTRSRFDLELYVEESGDGRLGEGVERYERESMERLLRHGERVLEAMVEEPWRRVSEVELLGEEERERLREWNRTGVEYERESCVHELFEAEARRRPGAVAVVCGEEEVSY